MNKKNFKLIYIDGSLGKIKFGTNIELGCKYFEDVFALSRVLNYFNTLLSTNKENLAYTGIVQLKNMSLNLHFKDSNDDTVHVKLSSDLNKVVEEVYIEGLLYSSVVHQSLTKTQSPSVSEKTLINPEEPRLKSLKINTITAKQTSKYITTLFSEVKSVLKYSLSTEQFELSENIDNQVLLFMAEDLDNIPNAEHTKGKQILLGFPEDLCQVVNAVIFDDPLLDIEVSRNVLTALSDKKVNIRILG